MCRIYRVKSKGMYVVNVTSKRNKIRAHIYNVCMCVHSHSVVFNSLRPHGL